MTRAGKFDYSDDVIVERIKEMASHNGGLLTMTDYRRLRQPGDPSVPAIVVRRKWSEWVELAGVSMGRDPNARPTVERRFDVDDALRAVSEFYAYTTETGVKPTHARYEAWQRDKDWAPCGSTTRYRLREKGITWAHAIGMMRALGAEEESEADEQLKEPVRSGL